MSAEKINSKLGDGMLNKIRQLSGKQIIALVILATTAVLVCLALFQYVTVSGYRLLYSDLSYQDSIAVSSWLSDRNISFRVKNNGRDIYIEDDQIHRARLSISREKQFAPSHSLKIVSESGLQSLLADPSQHYLSAVQNELEQTIAELDTIEYARVKIETGNTAYAFSGSDKPHASVFIEQAPGQVVSAGDLFTISNLVSLSVSGLNPDFVDIYDSLGRALSPDIYEQRNQQSPSSILSYQHMLENRLEQRASQVVDALIGPGLALIKVSVTLDNSQSEAIAEHYDPDNSTVKKEHTEFAPGSRYTVPDEPGPVQYIPPIPTTSSIDYEINKTVRTIITPAGSIERVAVSILVPGKRETSGDGSITMVPLTEEEIHSLEKAVSSVTSIQPDRGDTITVIPVLPHDSIIDLTRFEASHTILYNLVTPATKIVLLIIGFLFLYILIIKPIINILAAENDADTISVLHTESDHDNAMNQDDENENLTLDLKNEILRNPAPTAHIIKNWLQDT